MRCAPSTASLRSLDTASNEQAAPPVYCSQMAAIFGVGGDRYSGHQSQQRGRRSRCSQATMPTLKLRRRQRLVARLLPGGGTALSGASLRDDPTAGQHLAPPVACQRPTSPSPRRAPHGLGTHPITDTLAGSSQMERLVQLVHHHRRNQVQHQLHVTHPRKFVSRFAPATCRQAQSRWRALRQYTSPGPRDVRRRETTAVASTGLHQVNSTAVPSCGSQGGNECGSVQCSGARLVSVPVYDCQACLRPEIRKSLVRANSGSIPILLWATVRQEDEDNVSTQRAWVGVAEELLADGRISREQYEAATAQQKR